MKKLLVLSLVLLLGVAIGGMAKTNFFDDLYIGGDVTVVGTVTFADIDIVGDLGLTGNFTADGTVHSIDGSTSIALITAALNITGASFVTGDTIQTGSITLMGAGGDLTVGDDADVTGDFSVDGTSNLDEVDIDSTVQIDGTVTGGVSGTAYTWTWHSDSSDDNMIWTDSTACLTLTGIDSTDVLTVADGDVSITDDLSVDGIANFDVVDIDDNVTINGNIYHTGDTTQTGSTTISVNLAVDGIANFDVVDIDDAVDIAGAVTLVGNLYHTGDTTQTGSTTISVNLSVDGTANLDNTDIDGTLDVTGTTTLLTCSTSVINYTPIFTFGYDVGAATTFTTTDDTGAVAITMAGSGTAVTWAADSMTFTTAFEVIGSSTFDGVTIGTFDFSVDTTDFVVDVDGNITIAPTLDIVMTPTGGDIFITGDITQTGSTTITAGLDVDGTTNLDVTDIDDTLNVQGITTFQANTTVANATNAGGLYVTQFTIAHTQTASYTVGVIPANADVVEVEVLTTTAFTGGSVTTIDIGWSGTLEGYAGDLAIRTAGGVNGDEYSNMGDVGGSARSILAQITTDDSAGSCFVQIFWTMGTPGTP